MPPEIEHDRSWRAVATGLLLIGLLTCAGCSTLSGAAVGSLHALVAHNQQPFVPDPAKVAARPYFQLKVDSAARSGLWILGNVDHGREAWYGANDDIVFLHYGVLVKTWHMQPDIIATHLPADSPFITGLQHLRAPVTTTRTLDLPGYRYGVVATSRLVPEGLHEVDILGHAHRLLQIDEHIRAPAIGFSADNRYWVDPANGFVWKSRQTIPGGLTLTLTELRPYRGKQP